MEHAGYRAKKTVLEERGHYSHIPSNIWFTSEIIIDRGGNSNFFVS
jgi:hypothetical protein